MKGYVCLFDGAMGSSQGVDGDPNTSEGIPLYKGFNSFKTEKFKNGSLKINKEQCIVTIQHDKNSKGKPLYPGIPEQTTYIIPNISTMSRIDYDNTVWAKLMKHNDNELRKANDKILSLLKQIHILNQKNIKLETPKRTASTSQSNMVTCNYCGAQMSRQDLSVSGGRCNKCDKIINM